ncbi:MAG: hypothetical protein ACUZ8H_11405 [Candidatus Anammoxibacter sp.]
MKAVIDTSTLISLAKINCLEVILNLESDLLLSDEVYEESVIEGEKRDMPDATMIRRFIMDYNLSIIKVKSKSIKGLFSKIKKILPKGDNAVLSLALQENALKIITDDEGLSKIALSLGFNVSASPDLIFQSFKKGKIKYREFEKYIRNLVIENRLGSTVAEFYVMEGENYVKV